MTRYDLRHSEKCGAMRPILGPCGRIACKNGRCRVHGGVVNQKRVSAEVRTRRAHTGVVGRLEVLAIRRQLLAAGIITKLTHQPKRGELTLKQKRKGGRVTASQRADDGRLIAGAQCAIEELIMAMPPAVLDEAGVPVPFAELNPQQQLNQLTTQSLMHLHELMLRDDSTPDMIRLTQIKSQAAMGIVAAKIRVDEAASGRDRGGELARLLDEIERRKRRD